jgi:predicted kinase
MEAVILMGVQASGKTTFYRERFFGTHVRISLDLLKTRHRELRFMQVCLETQQPFVIDNTNPTQEDRQRYIGAARQVGFRVVGYYLQSNVDECKVRNESRFAREQVPLVGLLGTYKRLELPRLSEGFEELYYVRTGEDDRFVIERWSDEI